MAFATQLDLLARANARTLLQLAVPTDQVMPPEDALRVAIDAGDLSAYTDEEQQALTLALETIDKALGDADALILTYGIPATVQNTLLARLCSTVALYYLHDASSMNDDVKDAYDGVIATLRSHARGDLNLIPAPEGTPVIEGDVIIITSQPSRYTTDAPTDA